MTDDEVAECGILAHSADCIALTSFEWSLNESRLSCLYEMSSRPLVAPISNENSDTSEERPGCMATHLDCCPIHVEVQEATEMGCGDHVEETSMSNWSVQVSCWQWPKNGVTSPDCEEAKP